MRIRRLIIAAARSLRRTASCSSAPRRRRTRPPRRADEGVTKECIEKLEAGGTSTTARRRRARSSPRQRARSGARSRSSSCSPAVKFALPRGHEDDEGPRGPIRDDLETPRRRRPRPRRCSTSTGAAGRRQSEPAASSTRPARPPSRCAQRPHAPAPRPTPPSCAPRAQEDIGLAEERGDGRPPGRVADSRSSWPRRSSSATSTATRRSRSSTTTSTRSERATDAMRAERIDGVRRRRSSRSPRRRAPRRDRGGAVPLRAHLRGERRAAHEALRPRDPGRAAPGRHRGPVRHRALESTAALVSFLVGAGRASDLPEIVDGSSRARGRGALARGRRGAQRGPARRRQQAAARPRRSSKATGKQVEVKVIVDASVLGGIVARSATPSSTARSAAGWTS